MHERQHLEPERQEQERKREESGACWENKISRVHGLQIPKLTGVRCEVRE